MARKRKSEDLEKIEELERTNKELRTLNRHLMRHLKKLDRGFKFTEATDEDIEQEFEENNKKSMCPDCTKGVIIEVNLGIKRFFRCDLCNWRSKAEKCPK